MRTLDRAHFTTASRNARRGAFLLAAALLTACPGPNEPAQVRLDVAVGGQPGQGAVTFAGAQSCAPGSTCSASLPAGSTVTLTATPAAGFMVSSWGGACAGQSGPSCSFVLSAEATVSVTFVSTDITVQVAASGTGTAMVTSVPAGISCTITAGTLSGTCTRSFPPGTSVALTATPPAGVLASGWSGACAATNATPATATACTLTLAPGATGAATIALAAVPPLRLTLGATNTGSGSVTSTPAGIACTVTSGVASGACAADFAAGSTVSLAATAGSLSTFAAWGGACVGNPCQVAMTQPQGATVAFALVPQRLTVTGGGTGSGTITSSPAGISCTATAGTTTGTCAADFPAGATVNLTQAATNGSTFTAWGGACSGSTCQLTMSQARTVSAAFAAPAMPGTINLTMESNGTGSVVSQPAGINCNRANNVTTGNCSATFPAGTRVVLSTTGVAPSDQLTLIGCAGGRGVPCPITVQAGEVRNFIGSVSTIYYQILLGAIGATTGSGSVTWSGTLFNGNSGLRLLEPYVCQIGQTGGCGAWALKGTVVTMTHSGGTAPFTGWAGPCSGTGSCTFEPFKATTIWAMYGTQPAPGRVTITLGGTGNGTVEAQAQGGIYCDRDRVNGPTTGTCTITLPVGQGIALFATTVNGSTFAGWSLPGCPGTSQSSPCDVFPKAGEDIHITATFIPPPAP